MQTSLGNQKATIAGGQAKQDATIAAQQGLQTANLSPFVDAGHKALGTIQSTAPFVAPTDITEANDPGYQARLKLGQQMLERSAAAKGNILTGGTARAENQAAQDYASNEYGNVFNRSLTAYQNAFNNNMAQANLGQNSAAALNSNIGANTNLGVSSTGNNTNLGVNAEGQNTNESVGTIGQNLNTGVGVRDLYAQQVAGPSGLVVGGGNSQAAGTVGAANAINRAVGSIGTTAQQLAYGGLYGNGIAPPVGGPGGSNGTINYTPIANPPPGSYGPPPPGVPLG